MIESTHLGVTPVLPLFWTLEKWHGRLNISQAILNGTPHAVNNVAGVHQRILFLGYFVILAA